MKILIAPLILEERADANYYLTQNLLDLLTREGHVCGVSASEKNNFRNVALYPCVSPHRSIFNIDRSCRSYEEWLYVEHFGTKQWLEKDLNHLEATIDQFKPDLIICLDRIASLLAARKKNIPSYAFVNSAMYKKISLPPKAMM